MKNPQSCPKWNILYLLYALFLSVCRTECVVRIVRREYEW